MKTFVSNNGCEFRLTLSERDRGHFVYDHQFVLKQLDGPKQNYCVVENYLELFCLLKRKMCWYRT